MTPDQTGQVLAYVAAADRRTIGKADLLVWQDGVGDLPFADVMDAVRKHYRESTEFLMPAHVRRAVRKAREDRASRGVPAAPPAEIADRPGAYKLHLVRAIADIADQRDIHRALGPSLDREGPTEEYRSLRAQALGGGELATRQRAERWGAPCPVAWCSAEAERPCRDHDGNALPWQRTHSKRIVACRQAREDRMNAAQTRRDAG
ncbi:hypothetical protein [Nonomuraea sp. NPDC003214]